MLLSTMFLWSQLARKRLLIVFFPTGSHEGNSARKPPKQTVTWKGRKIIVYAFHTDFISMLVVFLLACNVCC